MIEITNNTNFKIDIDTLEQITKTLTNKDIELIITNNQEIASLNREYRDKDYPTDVLSFPLNNEFDNLPLGSIVISKEFIFSGAKEFNHNPKDEFLLLFIHGLLHLLGFDHEKDNKEMRNKEKEIINNFNLPKSLLVRNEINS